MKNFQTLQTFSDAHKNNVFGLLKRVEGINLKSIKKIMLLNGWTRPPSNFSHSLFLTVKEQVQFFFNLEKNKIYLNVTKKKRSKSYSGMRHILRLPVRGQRTHTNSKTSRNNSKKEI